MGRKLKEKDIPEPWFGNKGKKATAPKHTRAASKTITEDEAVEEATIPQPTTRRKGRPKGKAKEAVAVKGMKKTKALRSGTADVVLGRSKPTIPDPEELRRKRIEDLVACGREVKVFTKPGTRHACPTTAINSSSKEDIQAELEAGGIEMDGKSPSPEDRMSPPGGNTF